MSSPVAGEELFPRRTPLYDAHRRLGAKLIDFGGWSMPVNYATGIIDEHRTTRTSVGVFDVCHMGEIHFRGLRAGKAVQRLVTNDIAKLSDEPRSTRSHAGPRAGLSTISSSIARPPSTICSS